jgi:hypothetical protein
MSEPTDIKMIRGGKKEPCVYCGGEPHAVVLACPRIIALVISCEGYVEGIEFHPDWGKPVAGGDGGV